MPAGSAAASVMCFDSGRVTSVLDEAHRSILPTRPRRPLTPMRRGKESLKIDPLWPPLKLHPWGLALASNAIVIATGVPKSPYSYDYSEWKIAAFRREDGRPLWEVPLPGEPVVNGLCIDRHGSIVVALLNGDVVAVGGS
jgi:hypothetical protein